MGSFGCFVNMVWGYCVGSFGFLLIWWGGGGYCVVSFGCFVNMVGGYCVGSSFFFYNMVGVIVWCLLVVLLIWWGVIVWGLLSFFIIWWGLLCGVFWLFC